MYKKRIQVQRLHTDVGEQGPQPMLGVSRNSEAHVHALLVVRLKLSHMMAVYYPSKELATVSFRQCALFRHTLCRMNLSITDFDNS